MSTATPSLRPLIDRARYLWRTSPLPGFLRWWGVELRRWLPPGWRNWFGGGADWHLLERTGDGWVLRRAGRPDELSRWDASVEPRLQQAALVDVLGRVDREDLRLALLLPAAAVLRRVLPLPIAAKTDLLRVVGFEMDRQTPFSLSQVHYAARELVTPAAAGRFNAELIAVTRDTLDPLLAQLQGLNLTVDAVDLADGNSRLGVNLLPVDQIPAHTHPRRRLNLVLAGACVLLIGLMLGQWLHNRQAALAQMQEQVESMRGEAQQVVALRKQLQETAGAAGFLVQRKKAGVTKLSVLQDITERLPDSAWLERLSIDGNGQVGLQGQSPQAVKLLDDLKDSPTITGASFQGSIQPDPNTGRDRFYMTARIKPPVAGTPKPVAAAPASGGSL